MGKYLYILWVSMAALAVAGFVSCKKDMYDNSPGGPLVLSHETITVGKAAQTVWVGVTARDAIWTMTGAESWCSVNPTSGEKGVSRIAVTFEAYEVEEPEEGEEGEDTPPRTATFTFVSGGEEKTIAVEQLAEDITTPGRNAEYDVNEIIHKEFFDVWYYNGETTTATGDYNQSAENFFESYLLFLTRNALDKKRWSYNAKDFIYSYMKRTPVTEPADQIPLNYGMEFDMANHTVGGTSMPVARVQYVLEGSPAQRAGLVRGNWFNKVNRRTMSDGETNDELEYYYNHLIDSLVNPVEGFSPLLGMLNYIPYSDILNDAGRTVTVTPERFEASPILHTQLIEARKTTGDFVTKTGYMVYNSFDPRYEQELIAAFDERFGSEDLTHFILDLRYNKSGSVEMAELMANLLVPDEAAGKVFAKYTFAGGNAAVNNHDVKFAPHENGVKADSIFILTSRNTAGAAELLINGLRGIPDDVKLVMIGDRTEGMNAGMVKRTYESEEWRYDMWITAFRCENALGQGNYQWGFVPNGGEFNEWTTMLENNENIAQNWVNVWGWNGLAGADEDPLVQKAMNYVMGRSLMPATSVIEASSQERTGFPRQFSVQMNMVMNEIN